MKCGHKGCPASGGYQPLIRIKAAVIPADGKDVIAIVRLPWTVCKFHRFNSTPADVIGAIPAERMMKIRGEAYRRSGARPNPDRTDVLWVRITGAQHV